jgi:hypothetical protein
MVLWYFPNLSTTPLSNARTTNTGRSQFHQPIKASKRRSNTLLHFGFAKVTDDAANAVAG